MTKSTALVVTRASGFGMMLWMPPKTNEIMKALPMDVHTKPNVTTFDVLVGPQQFPGILSIPNGAAGVVVFSHGSDNSRFNPRNQFVARNLQANGFATLLFDLLSESEADDRGNVFDIELLSKRLVEAIDWVSQQEPTRRLPIGLVGAGTGSAAALNAASRRSNCVAAVVSRSGRPDLADDLEYVRAPTLLIVGGEDRTVIELNQQALGRLPRDVRLEIVPGATHLFSEPGTLEQVSGLASDWLHTHLQTETTGSAVFHDRNDAGRQLAAALSALELLDPLVLGIPRGGMITAAVIADAFHAELDVVLAHKLRSPLQPELAFGALGEDGRVYLNPLASDIPGLTQDYLEDERKIQLHEIQRRQRLYRSDHPAAKIVGRSVILTDDGIATGSTMFAAIEVVKSQQPHELIVAVPVTPPSTLGRLQQQCDRVVFLSAPATFSAVAQFYESFLPISDQQVVDLLNSHRSYLPKHERPQT
ncbi:phosphoribosyltransferase family protein [Novipirellula sp.]|uniref:phosphoribosyltransferase family protein n=1 Tax=Novipirellula sp. TaxID=2795430 RepID=UPI003563C1C5